MLQCSLSATARSNHCCSILFVNELASCTVSSLHRPDQSLTLASCLMNGSHFYLLYALQSINPLYHPFYPLSHSHPSIIDTAPPRNVTLTTPPLHYRTPFHRLSLEYGHCTQDEQQVSMCTTQGKYGRRVIVGEEDLLRWCMMEWRLAATSNHCHPPSSLPSAEDGWMDGWTVIGGGRVSDSQIVCRSSVPCPSSALYTRKLCFPLFW